MRKKENFYNGLRYVRTVSVCGVKYKVYLFDYNSDYVGFTDFNKKEILLCSFDDKLNETIFHELVHVYLFESGLFVYARDEILVNWLDFKFENILNSKNELINSINSLCGGYERK